MSSHTLSAPNIRAIYADACRNIESNLDNLGHNDVKQRLLAAVNSVLLQCGVPAVGQGDAPSSPSNAYFDFGPWQIVFGSGLSNKITLTRRHFVNCANVVYHEARHCEQWFRMMQAVASPKLVISNQDLFIVFQQEVKRTAPNMNTYMGVNLNAALAAVSDPDFAPVKAGDIQGWWRSVYAVKATHRGNVLHDLGTVGGDDVYQKYRGLPEEIDAWRCGDAVGEEVKEKIGLSDKRPCYKDWRLLSKAKWYQGRSKELQAVDDAFKVYEKVPNSVNKGLLKTAFTTWYGPKGGTTVRNGLDVNGIGVVDLLDQFLST